MKGASIVLLAIGMSMTSFANDLTKYVNPLMGTQSSYELSAGNTYPAIARPWGMNFWTPQTGKMGDGWTYTYDAHTICGFKQTHQPSPWMNDYGQFSIMPTVGAPEFDEKKRASWFSHKGEKVLPHYYSAYLADYDVLTELTPTERAAMFRFTFPETDSANVVIDAFDKESAIKIDKNNKRITGYSTRNSGGVPDNFKNYFVIEFDKPFSKAVSVLDSIVSDNVSAAVDHALAIVTFNTIKGEKVHAKVASSFISEEQALQNLSELDGMTFDAVSAAGQDAWNKVLGKILVNKDCNLDRLRIFYSCLYRSLLFPRKFYEIDKDGNIVHYSPHTGEVCDGFMYTDTGTWDTFRALFPLLNLMYPEVSREIQEGFLNHYRESGLVPEWGSPGHRGCMVGNNSASILADAYLKGVKVEDVETLWNAATAGVDSVHPTVSSSGRLGHEYYNTLGYVPYDVNIHENAARTLEYAYDDWCIYQLGKALGKSEKEISVFADRSKNYRNLFDNETKLMRGRNADGSFATPFSPLKWGDAFTEGNSWHYTWSVFHDPEGLSNLMGGKREFTAMLDSVFSVPPLYDDSYYGFPIHEIREMTVMNMGNYAHGNQPIQHMTYLYNYAGEPWKTQQWVRRVMDTMYTPTPDGYCGDEDNGQTSAWYVFSALGFYPVCPGSGEYVIGSPLFDKVTLNLDNGKTLEINATGNVAENPYINSLRLNDEDYTKNYLRHTDLIKGGRIDVEMSDTPNHSRGIADEDAPYSFSNEVK